MISKSEVQILSGFGRDLSSGKTIRGLSLSIGKPYPHVHRHVMDLLDRKVLLKRVVGPSHVCFVNLSSEQGRLALAVAALTRAPAKWRIEAEKVPGFIAESTQYFAFVEGGKLVVVVPDTASVSSKRQGNIRFMSEKEYFSTDRVKDPQLVAGFYRYYELLSERLTLGLIEVER